MLFYLIAIASLWYGLGCAHLEPEPAKVIDPPADAAAATTALLASLGLTGAARPAVYWYGPNAIDCQANGSPGSLMGGDCLVGATDGDTIIVLMLGGRLSDSPLGHELGHWVFGDQGHRDVVTWGLDYEHDQKLAGCRVGDANLALATTER